MGRSRSKTITITPPRSLWKAFASVAILFFVIVNVISGYWHQNELNTHDHVWVCRQTEASFTLHRDGRLELDRPSREFPPGPYDWVLTDPSFTPSLPWNWLSVWVVKPGYDPKKRLASQLQIH